MKQIAPLQQLKLCQRRGTQRKQSLLKALKKVFSKLYLPLLPVWLWVTVPSITLWPLTCRGLARGPGQQVEARAEMTLGGSPALSDREHPSPSVTTTRAQSSIWEALVVVGEGGRAKGSDKDWWLRGLWSSIIISQVWVCETASPHSGNHRWFGNGWETVRDEKQEATGRRNCNQYGGLDSATD